MMTEASGAGGPQGRGRRPVWGGMVGWGRGRVSASSGFPGGWGAAGRPGVGRVSRAEDAAPTPVAQLPLPGRPELGTCLWRQERGRGAAPPRGVHGVPRPGRAQAAIFKPKWGLFLPVSRNTCSVLSEKPQRPCTPWSPQPPPSALDCCYLKASWSRPEKGVIGGLGDERGQLPPPPPGACPP